MDWESEADAIVIFAHADFIARNVLVKLLLALKLLQRKVSQATGHIQELCVANVLLGVLLGYFAAINPDQLAYLLAQLLNLIFANEANLLYIENARLSLKTE